MRTPCFVVATLWLGAAGSVCAAQPVQAPQPVYLSRPDGSGIPHYSNEPQRPGDRLVMYSMASQVPRIKPTLPVRPLPSAPSTALLRRGLGPEVTMSVVMWRRNARTDALEPRPARAAPPVEMADPVVAAPSPSAGQPIDAAIRSAARWRD